jgi:hypothetical protein
MYLCTERQVQLPCQGRMLTMAHMMLTPDGLLFLAVSRKPLFVSLL